MASSVSNAPVSKPVDQGIATQVFMNGFAWSAEGGLFIPLGDGEVLLDAPQPKIEFNR